ncbi:hypothetical protein C2845_PM06G34080 [Panicum miliaceum]|uniref:Uncharacterized protein n=1 Tax=Panicum miliaceum TaxID=4540 RepID=A0A3L6RAP5_PANMI|nr:hypothetical protein C2845_PM06G34080 [Panicum miliaceum]
MLQGDVDDLYRFRNVTNHRPGWLEGIVAGHNEVGVPAAHGTVITDAEGDEDDEHQEDQCFFHGWRDSFVCLFFGRIFGDTRNNTWNPTPVSKSDTGAVSKSAKKNRTRVSG